MLRSRIVPFKSDSFSVQISGEHLEDSFMFVNMFMTEKDLINLRTEIDKAIRHSKEKVELR